MGYVGDNDAMWRENDVTEGDLEEQFLMYIICPPPPQPLETGG